ncbi:MAG: hypothetical protein P4N59_16875 [Negativicutes bacterium]|nr:hypothetical protein [Negativicutes bacterium]
MQELDLFTAEWSGMVQFDTSSDKIYINTDRGHIKGSLVLVRNEDGTVALYVRHEKMIETVKREEVMQSWLLKLDEAW